MRVSDDGKMFVSSVPVGKEQEVWILPENALAEDWEPYFKDCKHKPMLKLRGLMENLELPFDAPMEFECRHCLRPLMSLGWEVIK